MKPAYPSFLSARLTAVFCGFIAILAMPGDDPKAVILNIVGYATIAVAVFPWGGLHLQFVWPFIAALFCGAFDAAKSIYPITQVEFLYRLDSYMFLWMTLSLLTGFCTLTQELGRPDLLARSTQLRDRYIPFTIALLFTGLILLFILQNGTEAVGITFLYGIIGATFALTMAILALIWSLRNAARNPVPVPTRDGVQHD